MHVRERKAYKMIYDDRFKMMVNDTRVQMIIVIDSKFKDDR